MTKKEFDNYFVSQLPMLQIIVKGVAYKQNKKIDTDAAINEAYLHCHKNLDKLMTENQAQRMMVQFINMNIIWENSQLNKMERVNDIGEFYIKDDIDDIDDSLEDKLKIEEWYNERKSYLEIYRQQENDAVKGIIFDCFFKKNITKGLDLAKHLGINKDKASKYIRELKSDVKEFYNRNNNNNKI